MFRGSHWSHKVSFQSLGLTKRGRAFSPSSHELTLGRTWGLTQVNLFVPRSALQTRIYRAAPTTTGPPGLPVAQTFALLGLLLLEIERQWRPALKVLLLLLLLLLIFTVIINAPRAYLRIPKFPYLLLSPVQFQIGPPSRLPNTRKVGFILVSPINVPWKPKGPLHTRDWEPVTGTLQALSLVEKA